MNNEDEFVATTSIAESALQPRPSDIMYANRLIWMPSVQWGCSYIATELLTDRELQDVLNNTTGWFLDVLTIGPYEEYMSKAQAPDFKDIDIDSIGPFSAAYDDMLYMAYMYLPGTSVKHGRKHVALSEIPVNNLNSLVIKACARLRMETERLTTGGYS